jgi:hypothetical protein
MNRLYLSPLLLAVTTAWACVPDGDGNDGNTEKSADIVAKGEAAPGDCLLLVWSSQKERNPQFDRDHDFVEGGAISCATGTSASQFDVAISTLRDAARSGDKARLLREVGLPLLYIDGEGKRREIKDRTEVEAVFDEIFDPAMIEVLQKIDLSRMSVAKDQGGFFELGAIWLVVDRDGGRPRLMTVNRQALDEALDTARERADRNQGEPVPFD